MVSWIGRSHCITLHLFFFFLQNTDHDCSDLFFLMIKMCHKFRTQSPSSEMAKAINYDLPKWLVVLGLDSPRGFSSSTHLEQLGKSISTHLRQLRVFLPILGNWVRLRVFLPILGKWVRVFLPILGNWVRVFLHSCFSEDYFFWPFLFIYCISIQQYW